MRSAGVSPIIRLLHEMDLSQPVDRGRSSFFSDMSDAITRGLARFIAAGLHFSDRDPAQEPTGQSTTLVDESNPLSKSQNSAALTDISESPDFNRLFFTSPYSTAQDSSDLREDWRRQFESPVTRRSAQPKLSTLHAGGSDVQSQHVSYSGSHDSPWASPEKPKLSLAQRYRQQESLPTTTASSLPASPARWPTNSNGAQVHPEDEDAGEVLAPDGDEESRRNSSASTEMFTCEEEPQTSSDNDREADVSGNQDDTVSISAVEDSFLAPGQATATYSVAITPPHSPTARQNTAVAWPSAPIEPPSLDPKDLKPTPAKEKARPPNLNLERPLPLVPGERSPLSAGPSLSASTSALPSPKKSLSGSPSFSPSSPTSQQSTVKAAQPSRRRRFTLSFSRKKPPKNLKAEISAPILIPDQTQGGEIPSPVRRLYIDGSEAKVAYMEYHDSSSATVAVPPEMALKESQNDSMPHKGHDWRWEMCTIPRVPTVKAVSWGGFNVDVVGVRESIFGGRSFICECFRSSYSDCSNLTCWIALSADQPSLKTRRIRCKEHV